MKDVYLLALNHWGEETQLIKTQEEAGELITAISKTYYDQASEEDIVEEIVDMQIMLNQLKIVFSDYDFDEMIGERENELGERLE